MSPEKLKMLRNLPQIMMEAVKHGVTAYANGFTGKPFVDAHFTRTNAERYVFPPLNPEYARWKKKHYGNKPILIRSGHMRKTVNSKAHLITIRGATVLALFRGLAEYAIYHHKGEGNLPMRSPVMPSLEDREMVIAQAKAYLARVTGQKIV